MSSSEEIGGETKPGAGDVGKEQCGSTGGDDPPMDLGYFKMRIDRRIDRDDVIATPQLVDERP